MFREKFVQKSRTNFDTGQKISTQPDCFEKWKTNEFI